MKCLSVKQPWASLIASGKKSIENRSWVTNYRGPLVIISSRAPDAIMCDYYADGPRGVALCVVDLVDCRLATRRDTRASLWACESGSYAWVLANVRPLSPAVPVRGMLGLFDPPPELLCCLATATDSKG